MMRVFIKCIGLLVASFFVSPAQAQISEIADVLFGSDTLATEHINVDSLKLVEMETQMQQMKLNEILYLQELEQSRSYLSKDSLKHAANLSKIDSLRAVTNGAAVVVEEDTLFTIYSARGGSSFAMRATNTTKIILELGDKRASRSDSLYLLPLETVTEIMSGERVIYSVTRDDALWMGKPIDSLANEYKESIDVAIKKIQAKNSFMSKLKRAGKFLLIVVIQIIVIWGLNFYYRKIRTKSSVLRDKLKPVAIKTYEFLTINRQMQIINFVLNVLRYLLIIISLIITIPLLFSIFPQTKGIADKLFGYIIDPVKSIFFSFINYIPNIFTIIIIWLCIKYVIKGLKFLFDEIENENLKITGFYPDWARPTFTLIRFLLYAFMIAMIYPHLPGSESPIFKGISVFVGLLVSFGSSGVIGNIISGMIITYMRPFRIGDRIQLDETVGNVIEKTPLVTRIRTPKNEVITIPNSFIMSHRTTNYTVSAEDYGLIVHTSVSVGYEYPWQKVHDLLIRAAKMTGGVMPEREPFVYELKFEASAQLYQINAYIDDADRLSSILSELHSNIQSLMKEEGVEMENPVFFSRKGGVLSPIVTNIVDGNVVIEGEGEDAEQRPFPSTKDLPI